MITHSSGSHVVHALLDQFPMNVLKFLFDQVHRYCNQLALDQHGLCVLKKCITLALPEEFHRLADRVYF